jgi:hypothetical protein
MRGVGRDHDARCYRSVERLPSVLAPLRTDREDLDFADDRERQRQRMAADESLELDVATATGVDVGEDVRVHGERPRRYFVGIHLQLSEDGHKRVAFLVGGLGVVQAFWIDGLARALLAREVLKRPLPPELLGIESENELLASVHLPQHHGSSNVRLRVVDDLATKGRLLTKRRVNVVVELLSEADLNGWKSRRTQTRGAFLEVGLDEHAYYPGQQIDY